MNIKEIEKMMESEDWCHEKWQVYKELSAHMCEDCTNEEVLLSAVDYLAEYQQWLARAAAPDKETMYKKFDPMEWAKYNVKATLMLMAVDCKMKAQEEVSRLIEKNVLKSCAEEYLEED